METPMHTMEAGLEGEFEELAIELNPTTKKQRRAARKRQESQEDLLPEQLVLSYKQEEQGSFIDPSQPAPHPAYYYDTIHLNPSRPALTQTSITLEAGASHVPDDLEEEEQNESEDESLEVVEKKGCCGRGGAGGKEPSRSKFGMWDGVVVSCLLNIFGVIMFLRLPWVVGQAGLWQATLIVLLSTVITTLTTLSMSAITTNGKIGGGGAYYLISRSLGPQFGGAIGVLFSIGQAIAVSLYLIGFAETLAKKLRVDWGVLSLTDDELWDVRIWSNVALVMLLVMALIGVGWVIKMQVGLLILIMAIIVCVIAGAIVGPIEGQQLDPSFVGFNETAFSQNINSDYQPIGDDPNVTEGFFSVFAVFFPAVTGIMAGANISGDLKDPGQAIPKGTLISIFFSATVYIILAWIIGATTFRTGPEAGQGLLHNNTVMEEISVWGPLIVIGVFAATLSSALASLVGAPRILQAVCKDKVFRGKCIEPIENLFARGRQPSNDPIPGYFLTFAIAVGMNLIGDLNTIAPIISMFFMITYALVNLACFAGSLSNAPGWRPQFRFYNPWLSAVGAVLCVVVMFLISWWAALAAVGVGAALYILLYFRPPEVSWGPSGHAYKLNQAARDVLRLKNIPFHAKTWRPHFMVLVHGRDHDNSLIQFMRHFSKGGGLILVTEVLVGEYRERLPELQSDGYLEVKYNEAHIVAGRVRDAKVKGEFFHTATIARSFRQGAQMLLLSSGIGGLRPNTLVVGFPDRWHEYDDEQVEEYVNVVRDGFEIGRNMCIVRNPQLVDYTKVPTRTIDIWWLVDDGGFTILLPWLFHQKAYWEHTSMRILTVPGSAAVDKVAKSTQLLQNLVTEFRIPATVHVEVPDILEDDEFEAILETSPIDFPPAAHERTRRYILLSKLVEEHSSEADLVFCTLPFPRDEVLPRNWLAWLELISSSEVPTIYLRGNQQNVLTLYA